MRDRNASGDSEISTIVSVCASALVLAAVALFLAFSFQGGHQLRPRLVRDYGVWRGGELRLVEFHDDHEEEVAHYRVDWKAREQEVTLAISQHRPSVVLEDEGGRLGLITSWDNEFNVRIYQDPWRRRQPKYVASREEGLEVVREALGFGREGDESRRESERVAAPMRPNR